MKDFGLIYGFQARFGANIKFSLRDFLETTEAHIIEEAVVASNGNKTKAAEMLGLQRMTLVAKMKKYGMQLNKPSRKP